MTRFHQTQLLHYLHREQAEVVFVLAVTGAGKVRKVMMIVLQTRTERGCNGQPFAEVHCVIMFILILPRAKSLVVSPIVLNHIYPERNKAYAQPEH